MSAQSKPKRTTARRGLHAGIAICAGLLMCEGLLRVLVPFPIFYSTWFTPGIHQADEEFGFVFRPNYNGAMRNADKVWMQPIQLDHRGFRESASTNKGTNGEHPMQVVMLGGASMGFCYGLKDSETLHHRVAEQIERPIAIDIISWPGFTLAQDIRKLERFTEPDRYDVAVVLAYDQSDFQADSSWDQVEPFEGQLRIRDSVVLPDDPAAALVGNLYYESFILAGACRQWQVPRSLIAKLSGVRPTASPNPAVVAVKQEESEPVALSAARRLLDHGIGSVLVVALPHQNTTMGPASLSSWETDEILWLDLRELPTQQSFDWIAYGHYGSQSTRQLAGPIAQALNRLP